MPGYSHLTRLERDQIADLTAQGFGVTAIARAIGRAPSTISRELRRNAHADGTYRPIFAEGSYRYRRQRAAILENDKALRSFVVDRLSEGWTPEQITGWLRRGIEIGLRARRSKDKITDKTHISQRPAAANDRAEPGHWEADLVICKRARPLLVLHERKTRLTVMTRLASKTAAETVAAITDILARLDPGLRRSMTFDNGGEFARHVLIRDAFAMATFGPGLEPVAAIGPHSATPTPLGRRAASRT